MSEDNKTPVSLVDPGVPADQGLSALGLLMQLGGSLFAAIATLGTFFMLLTGGGRGGDKALVLLVLGATITRSIFHRAAGTELLYGTRGLDKTQAPLAGMRRYILVALAQSALVFLVLVAKFGAPMKIGVAVTLGLVAWPVTLAILSQLPRFKRFELELPVAEDKGFEGASILMTVLGICGALGGVMFLLVMLDGGGRMMQGPGVLILLATILLVIRSCLHVQAGLSGLRETSVDRSVELANRYANFGVISAFCAGGSMLLLMMALMRGRFDPTGLIMVVGLCWMLMAWPLIIRRFFSDRQFADLMAGDQANLHRRSPDAGLTGLGWLLFAHAIMGAAMLIPQLIVPPESLSRGMGEMMAMFGGGASRSLWWSAGLIVLQAWAGFELVRMSSTHRIVGTVYAIVAIGIGIYISWPLLQSLKHIGRMGPSAVTLFIPLAIQLVIPIATLVLVNRQVAPTARARFRTPPAAPPAQ